jgi:ADP-heptose:LPS heptosyltransferase
VKILVLSLLRLGDFFQQQPLLEELRQEGNEVHVLINEGLAAVPGLFPQFRFHIFPRETAQRILAHPQCNALGAFAAVSELVDRLNAENFDRIENWTHQTLSAHLMDLLTAPDKKGARFENGRLVEAEGGLRYLNENWGPARAASFQWIDAVARAMSHTSARLPSADFHRTGAIYLQVLTSDAKKNWSLDHWRRLADVLVEQGEDVRILCAPFEEKILREKWGDAFPLCVLGLSDLRESLATAKLVVTGDTSVAHLAALQRAPVLGIYLGSADPRKTAPRQNGARILWASTACSPCRHRDDCSQPRHFCGDEMSFETVQQEVMEMIQHGPRALRPTNVRRFEVLEGSAGAAVLSEAGQKSMGLWAQVVWDFYLNGDHENPVAPYGSAARVLLQRWGNHKETREWVDGMKERLDVSFGILGNVSETLWTLMRDFNQNSQLSAQAEHGMRTEVNRLAEMWKETDFVGRLVESNLSSDATPFVRIRQRKESLQEVFDLFSVQKNLIRVLDQELKERGAGHGARA